MALRNLEERRSWQKAYYSRNRDQLIQKQHAYYRKNRKRCLASVKAYKNRHRQEYLDYWRRRSVSKSKGPDRNLLDLKAQMLYSLKNRAARRGIEFNLSAEDLQIPEFCPVFGMRLISGRGVMRDCSPSVDRIDPSEGYVKGNVQVISQLANAMKRNATAEQLQMFARWVLQEK